MLLFIFLNIVYCQDFAVFGLDTNFDIVPDTFSLCNYTNCPNHICDTLQENYTSYVVFSPLSITMICERIPIHNKVNMIVFGMDKNRIIITTDICHSTGECLSKGCYLYNKFTNMGWIVFTGRCY